MKPLSNEDFLQHPTFAIFTEIVDALGIDMEKWEYGEGTEMDLDGRQNIIFYYNNTEIEEISMSTEFVIRDDIDNKWHLEDFSITTD